MNVNRGGTCVGGIHGAGDGAKCSGDDFFGGESGAIGVAVAAGPDLIARMDFRERAGPGVVELDGIGSVTANDGGFGSLNHNALAARRDGDGSGSGIDCGCRTVDAALLPVLQFLLVAGGKIGASHDDDG